MLKRLGIFTLLTLLLGSVWSVEAGQVYRARLASGSLDPVTDNNPTILATSCPNGTLATSISPLTITGQASDNSSVSVSCTNDKGGACVVTGTTSWSASVTLAADDTNTITFTASDGSPPNGTASCVVTYTTPDPTDPVLTITGPTSNPDYGSTTLTNLVMSGTCQDNVACTQVRCQVNSGPWVTDSSVANGWSLTVSLSVGSNIVSCEGFDAQNNAGTASMTAERTIDTGTPVVTITALNDVAYSGPITTTTGAVKFSGTATDAGGVVRVRIFPCDASAFALQNSAAQSVTNTNGNPPDPTNWTWSRSNKRVALGTHTYCARAWDGDGNMGEATPVTITYTAPVIIHTSTAGVPPARQNTAWSYKVYAEQGTGSVVWDNGSGGSTFADGDCAGLSISEVQDGAYEAALISGTPTGLGNCSLTLRATDNGNSALWNATLVIQSGALTGPHEHYDALVAHGTSNGNLVINNSFRTTADRAAAGISSTSPYWTTTADGNWGRLEFDEVQYSGFTSIAAHIYFGPTKPTYADGSVLYHWEMMWGPGLMSFQCLGGSGNQFQSSYSHKEAQAPTDRSSDPGTDHTIYTEMQVGFYNGDGQAADCAHVGEAGWRFYGEEPRSDTGVKLMPDKQQPGVPTCGTPASNENYPLKMYTVYTITLLVEIGKSEADFSEWAACANAAALRSGSYYRITAWIQGEFDTAPTRQLWLVPNDYFKDRTQTPFYDRLSGWWGEYDTSSNAGALLGLSTDSYIYTRNVIALRNYTLPATPETDTLIFRQPRR